MSSYMRLALTPWDRVRLFSDRVLAFQPHAPLPRRGRKRDSKGTVAYGRLKIIASDFLDGAYPGLTSAEVADLKGVKSESLRNSIWSVRRERRKCA